MRAYRLRLGISACLAFSLGIALTGTSKGDAKPAAKASGVQTKESQAAMTPASALDALREGNKRFQAGTSIQKNLPGKVKATANGQYPFAAILGCADSRVSPELVFDQAIGDVFGVRLAGNVVDTDALGSIEYAVKVLGAKLIVVLGHTSCGAVKGAIDDVKLGHVTDLVAKIKPAVQAVGPGTSKDHAYVDKVGAENVRKTVKEIRETSPLIKEMLDSKAIGIVGGMYDIETGAVTFFEP